MAVRSLQTPGLATKKRGSRRKTLHQNEKMERLNRTVEEKIRKNQKILKGP